MAGLERSIMTNQLSQPTQRTHRLSHQDGGGDEINVDGLAGDLADEQDSAWARVSGKPATFTPSAHKASHQDGGGDEISVEGLAGDLADEQDSAWTRVSGKPTTFSPSAHKASHQDGGADEIDATGLVGRDRYVDRGDPTAYDFVLANFTTDGAWHDLDLSSIVPANATTVLLRVIIQDNLVGMFLNLRKNGNIETYNTISIYTQVAETPVGDNLIVSLDANRIMEYFASNTTWTGIWICVRGWWI